MKILFVLLITLPITAFANGEGKISKIMKGQKKVVVDWTAQPPAKDSTLIFTSEKNESCEGKVSTVTGNATMATLTDCDIVTDLKIGQAVTVFGAAVPPNVIEPIQPLPPGAPAPARKGQFRFGAGAFYSTANELRFESAKYNSSSGYVRYETDTAAGIQAELAMMEPAGWGFNGGLTIEGKRNLKSVSLSLGGATGSGSTSGGMVLNMSTLYGNAVYRWEKFFLPFGLNLSLPSVDSAPIALQGIRGNLGIQFGIGYLFTEKIMALAEVRVLTVTAPSNASTVIGSTIELGTGTLSGLNLGLKAHIF